MLEQAGFQGTATVVSSLSDVWVSQLTPGARFTLCAQGTPGTQHFSWASHSCPEEQCLSRLCRREWGCHWDPL